MALYLDPPDPDRTPESIFAVLAKKLSLHAPAAHLDLLEPSLLRIRLHDLITHEIRLALPFDRRPQMPIAQQPRLAIIVDDMGENMHIARSLLNLNYPVTFSILPRSTYATATAEAAHKAGREVMIHQPMQPVDYPDVKPGPGALFLGQSREEIMRIVTDSVNRVPHAVGINNHMGSRITQDQASMDAVADAVIALRGERPLFVLDSLTHPRSKLHAVARQAGIRSYSRDVFLDEEEDVTYILRQLDRAAQIARQTSQAVAIGHPLPATLEALKQWQFRRDPGILIVPLANLNP
jgi:polysaccharide deacetylase 2 family uncharacterized protein YibQ